MPKLSELMPTTIVPIELPDPTWLRQRDRTSGLGAGELLTTVRVRSRLLICIAAALQACDRLDGEGDHSGASWLRGHAAAMIDAWESNDLSAGLRCALEASGLDAELGERTEELVSELTRQ